MDIQTLLNLKQHNVYVTDMALQAWGTALRLSCVVSPGEPDDGTAYAVTFTGCTQVQVETAQRLPADYGAFVDVTYAEHSTTDTYTTYRVATLYFQVIVTHEGAAQVQPLN